MINNVSDTAFWIAEYRANETDRPDALFRDPLARRLSGEQGREIANSMPGSNMTAWSVVMRTVIIDDFIERAIREGVDVILNLGAGLDTRPYRMNLPSALRWIEVDFAPLIEFKEAKLADETPKCVLQRVKLDLSNRAARAEFFAATNASAKQILVLTEGVVPYLSEADVSTLADDIRSMQHVRYWIVDYFSRQVMKMRDRRGMRSKMQNAPFKFDPDNWFAFFASHGWRPHEMKYLAMEGYRLHRMPPVPWYFGLIFRVRSLFMSADERRRMAEFAGYGLMERT